MRPIKLNKDGSIPKKNKMGNTKITFEGVTYDSKWEAHLALLLKADLKPGHKLRYHVPIKLVDKFEKNGKKYRAIWYEADFILFNENGAYRVIDAKGHETEVFKIKRKLFEMKYPELTIEVIKYDKRKHGKLFF